MTKDELKKEAEEYATKRASKLYTRNMWDRYYQTYIDSAEPREKQIQIDAEHIIALQKQNGELTDKVKELEKACDETQELLDKQIEATYKLDKENAELKKENAEAKNLIEELASSLSVVGECDEEECELINKAQKFINKPIF